MRKTIPLNPIPLKIWNVVRDPDVMATTMFIMAAKSFGNMDFVNTDAVEIRDGLEDRWRRRIPNHAFDRLMAAVSLVGSDLFTSNIRSFAVLAEVLNGSELVEGLIQLPSVAECCWAVAEKTILAPYPNEHVDESILIYIKERLAFEGFPTVPPLLTSLVDPSEYSHNYADTDLDPELSKFRHTKIQETEDYVHQRMRQLRDQLVAIGVSGNLQLSAN